MTTYTHGYRFTFQVNLKILYLHYLYFILVVFYNFSLFVDRPIYLDSLQTAQEYNSLLDYYKFCKNWYY